jgi:antirestriction protein ArdC
MGVWSSICQDKCRTRRRLRADLRITDNPHAVPAQYLASWLAVLKADKKVIFAAA